LSKTAKEHIIKIVSEVVERTDAYRVVRSKLATESNNLIIKTKDRLLKYDLKKYKNIWLVGTGKAGASMTKALNEVLGKKITSGLVTVKYGHTLKNYAPANIEIAEAGHPTPDAQSVAHCKRTIEILKNAGAADLVLAVISGGGSALWAQPVSSVSLEDLQLITGQLVAGGATIEEINALRKHLSQIKGGFAAQYAFPAEVLVFVVSDVLSDNLDAIASGPFTPDSTTYFDAWHVLEKYLLLDTAPQSVIDHLKLGLSGKISETPKSGNSYFDKVQHILCATNNLAICAATEAAKKLGYEVYVCERALIGLIHEEVRYFIQEAQKIERRPACLIAGGEPVVNLGNKFGKGGRNQEFSLTTAFMIQDLPNITVASFGTDGNDGNTTSAGAIVDGTTIVRAKASGLKPEEALKHHDANPLFAQLNDLLTTGATNTNVADIQIAILND